MVNDQWKRWILQTATTWPEISRIIAATGIDFIDTDHRRMTELTLKLNVIIEAQQEGQFSLELVNEQNKTLESLARYTAGHFNREERFMNILGLKDTQAHQRVHQTLLEKINDTRQQLAEGRSAAVIELRLIILEWVIEHINTMDKEFFGIERLRASLGRACKWQDIAALVQPTAIPIIDSEHQNLVQFALVYGNKLENETDIDQLREAFINLSTVSQNHFTNEEEFMRRCGIPQAVEHQQMHQRFIQDLVIQWSPQQHPNAFQFKEYFLLWLLQHINSVDLRYFKLDQWAPSFMANATQWNDIEWLIQKTSIEELDIEHRQLVEITLSLNEFLGKRSKTRTGDDVELFEKLHTCAAFHFSHEEEIMKQHTMPGMIEHIQEHGELLSTVNRWLHDYRNGRLSITNHFRMGIMLWLLNHTGSTDYKTFNPKAHIGIEV